MFQDGEAKITTAKSRPFCRKAAFCVIVFKYPKSFARAFSARIYLGLKCRKSTNLISFQKQKICNNFLFFFQLAKKCFSTYLCSSLQNCLLTPMCEWLSGVSDSDKRCQSSILLKLAYKGALLSTCKVYRQSHGSG